MKVWYYIWRLLRFQPWLCLLSLVINTLAWLTYTAYAYVPKLFFDALLGEAPATISVWSAVGFLALTELSRIFFQFWSTLIRNIIEYTARALLQYNLLQRILELPGMRALPYAPGEAVSRFRDDVSALTGYLIYWPFIIGSSMFVIVALVIMVRISPLITMVVFLPLVVIVVITQRVRPKIEAYRNKRQQATGDVTGALGEMFNAVLAIKVAQAEERVVEQFARLSDERRQRSLQDVLFTNGLDAIFGCTSEIGTAIILLIAANAMHTGNFTVGDFLLFAFYLGEIPWIIGSLSNIIPEYRRTGVSVERLNVLLQRGEPGTLVKHHRSFLRQDKAVSQPAMMHTGNDLESITLQELSYSYPDTTSGIQDISLRIPKGSFTVITGRIGSGKTTLLRVLLGLLPKQQGEIYWNGERVLDPASFFVPPRSAYTAQIPKLFSETLRDNKLLGLADDPGQVQAAIQAAVMERDMEDFPEGLETLLGPRGVRLSGGQAQRTAAARMFVRNPQLLVFDDLSSALDVETEHMLWERLFARGRGTFLVVSHRHAALQRSDHIIVLKDGHIESQGTLDRLLSECEEMRRIWRDEVKMT